MNTMTKSLVMVLSLFLFGANAYAAPAVLGLSHAVGSKTIEMPIVDTKEKAYSLGFQELKNLKLKSGTELTNELHLFFNDQRERDSLTIQEANVTVQELMNEQGKIVYRGMVNVNYHYSVKLDSR